jgi:hypothetical protein
MPQQHVEFTAAAMANRLGRALHEPGTALGCLTDRVGRIPQWRPIVSLVIRFSPPSLTAEQYDEVVRRLTEAGVFPADGLDYELCFGSEGNLKVSQVWDSREQLDAFGERLRPILAELGINPGEPEVLEVHNIIKR